MDRFQVPQWRWPRWGTQAVCWTILALPFIALNTWLVRDCGPRFPIQQGTAAEFWDGLYPLGMSGYFITAYPPEGELCYYGIRGFHGIFLHSVPTEEVRQLAPTVRGMLVKKGIEVAPEERALLEGDGDVPGLIVLRIAAERRRSAKALKDDGSYHDAKQVDFQERLGRARRFWANVLFEGLFLNGLLAFVVISLAWTRSHWRRALAMGAVLPILFLPHFLGYCPWTFTSAGPIGGVVYPQVLIQLRRLGWDWTSLDRGLVEWLPQPLEPLSQMPGHMISISGWGAPAPTFLVVAGVALGMITFFASWAYPKWRIRRSLPVRTTPPDPDPSPLR